MPAGYALLRLFLTKLTCQTCLEEVTREKEMDGREVTDIIRESVGESILQVSAPEPDRPAPSTSTATLRIPPKSDDSSDNEGFENATCFDFASIALAAVGRAIASWTSCVEKLLLEGAEQEKIVTTVPRAQSSWRFCGRSLSEQIFGKSHAGLGNVKKSTVVKAMSCGSSFQNKLV